MAKVTHLRPPPVNRCAGTNKAGKPCNARPLGGRDKCLSHDPDKGPLVRAAGVAARLARPAGRLTEEQAAELSRITTPADRQRAMGLVAYLVATGQLDPKAADRLIQAASTAQRDHEAAREDRERAGACTFCKRDPRQVKGFLFRRGAASICQACFTVVGAAVAEERQRAPAKEAQAAAS